MNRKAPLVSVIIPIFNAEKYLVRCLDSVLSQTLKDIEVIAVNDGSSDGSAETLAKYSDRDNRIIVINQANSGTFLARKNGIENAKGKYLAFIDSDDYIELDMLEVLASEIGCADMISSNYFYESKGGYENRRGDSYPKGLIKNALEDFSFVERFLYNEKKHEFRPFTRILCNKLFIREKMQELVGDMTASMKVYEDSLLLYRYLMSCKDIMITDYAGYHYCYNKQSATRITQPRWFKDVGDLYIELDKEFSGLKYSERMLYQLRTWIALSMVEGLNKHAWNDDSIWLPQYIFDLSAVKGKKIALYGAGRSGQDVFRQMKGLGYEVVAWADRHYKDFAGSTFPIVPPEGLLDSSFDVVFLAAAGEDLADNMKKSLVELGIPEEKIIWTRPMTTFG